MRPKSWFRNLHGQVAISGEYLPDGRVSVRVGNAYYAMTEAEWGALPIWSGAFPFRVA
jgi:hypothetical protein